MSVDKNLLQVSTIQPRTATANVYRWLVSIVLILVSVSVTQVSSEKVAQATYDPSALVLMLDTSRGSKTVQLPITGVTSAITINWGDGSSESSSASYPVHTYVSDGTYTVVVTGGAFSQFGGVPSSSRAVFTAVQQWGTYQPTSMQRAFDSWVNLTSVPATIPSSVTNMSYMFYAATAFNQSVDSWNTSNVTDMSHMFRNASAFNQPVGSWNTANVTNMSHMFNTATAFNQPVGSWNTANVTNMGSMFSDAHAFNQPVGSWNTANVTDMSRMFRVARAFNQPVNTTTDEEGVTYWDTSKVTNMSLMFHSASAFNQPVNLWDTSNVTNMFEMFRSASTFNQSINTSIVSGVTYWDTSKVTNMSLMFLGASAFNQPVNLWDTSNVTNMSGMFANTSAFNQSVDTSVASGATYWNTANVTNMSTMFRNASVFNQAIGSWNTASVTNMSQMFEGARAFNQPVGSWNTANVTNMSTMFRNASVFNQAIGSWNTASVTNMQFMFFDALAFNQSVDSWDTSNVVTISHMLRGALAFNQPVNSWDTSSMSDLSNAFQIATAFNQPVNLWKTSNVTRMNHMFAGASSFNQPVNTSTVSDVTYWDTSKVQNMSSMFAGASSFNQSLNLWDTSSVTDMSSMFRNASVFNQPVDSWATSSVTNMTYMFYGASAFNQPVNSWNTANVTNMSFMFHGASVFNQPVNSWNTANVTSLSHTFYSASAFNQPVNSWRVPNVTTMQSMFTGVSTFDTGNYDLFLISLSSQTLKPNVRLDAAAKYSSAASAARANIVSTNGWTINDQGLDQNYSSTPSLTVTYNSQSGTAVSAGSTTSGGSLSEPSAPTRSGFVFTGWFTASSGGSAISFPYTHGQTASFTLYAQWTASSLTVTYNSQSGTAVSAGSTTSGGVIASAPVAPSRTGYVFTGWFAASTGGSAISFPYTHGRTADFTLYARWSQASLHGISSVSKIGTITTTANVGNTFAVDTESSSVSLRYPANGLPADTVIDVYLVNDLSRARSLVAPAGGFVVSLVVAWLAADGSVPLMASGKPLSMTIVNDTIKAGAKTYAIVGGEVTLLGTASVNGSVTISITEDPEIVIVNPVVVSQPSSAQPSSAQPSSAQPSASQPSSIARRNPVTVVELLPQVPGATSKIAAILNTVAGKLPPKPTVFAPKILSNGQIARIAFTPIQIKAPPANAPVAPLGAKVFPIGAKIEQSQVTPTAPVSRVAAGESKATFGGQTIETEMSRAANGPAVLSAGPATIALAGFADEPAASSSNSGGSTGLTASSSTPLEIATGSFIASTPVQVWLFSTPLLLAETAVDENGNFAAAISLPSSIPAGNHTLQIQGFVYAAGGAAEVTANIGVSIAAAAVGTRWSGTFPMYVASITPSVKSQWTKFVSAQNSTAFACSVTPVKPERNSKANIRLYENRLIAMTTMLKYNGCVSVETLAPSTAKKSSVANRTWTVVVQSQASTVAFRWVHDFSTYASTINPAQKATWTALSTDFAGQKLECVITGAEPIRNSLANARIFANRNENMKAYLLKNGCSEVQINKAISAKTKLASRTKWRVEASVVG